MNKQKEKGAIPVFLVFGGLFILAIGVVAGRNFKKEVIPTVTPVPTAMEATPSVTMESKGKISGYLIYPSDHIPEEMGVCAEVVGNTSLTTCVKQIKDKKYKTGVGFEMELDPGMYYVYAFLDKTKAYYNEFVLCGLEAKCKSHVKIPVVVKAGSVDENILPQDWYDQVEATPTTKPVTTLAPSATSAPTVTVAPTNTPVPPTPTTAKLILNPGILKIIPTATPTPIKIVIPTIKIPQFNW